MLLFFRESRKLECHNTIKYPRTALTCMIFVATLRACLLISWTLASSWRYKKSAFIEVLQALQRWRVRLARKILNPPFRSRKSLHNHHELPFW